MRQCEFGELDEYGPELDEYGPEQSKLEGVGYAFLPNIHRIMFVASEFTVVKMKTSNEHEQIWGRQ
jgi:hypothetical protein